MKAEDCEDRRSWYFELHAILSSQCKSSTGKVLGIRAYLLLPQCQVPKLVDRKRFVRSMEERHGMQPRQILVQAIPINQQASEQQAIGPCQRRDRCFLLTGRSLVQHDQGSDQTGYSRASHSYRYEEDHASCRQIEEDQDHQELPECLNCRNQSD